MNSTASFAALMLAQSSAIALNTPSSTSPLSAISLYFFMMFSMAFLCGAVGS